MTGRIKKAGRTPLVRQRLVLDVDAIVLDIDDTLYLERDYVRSGFYAVGQWARAEFGIEDFAERAWVTFESGTRGHIFDEVLKSCGQRPDDTAITEMIARYRSHTPTIALVHDARAALDRWQGTVPLATVTDGPLSSQRAKARALKLHESIPFVIFTAALGYNMGKPHRAGFELAQEQLGISGERCVYVADNPAKDFIGPKKLGWQTVRVRRRLGLHVDVVSGSDVDHEISDLRQLERSSALQEPACGSRGPNSE
jgi:putative hydrolase of the HAD superfamily